MKEILDWADAHFQRTGAWPTMRSGQVAGVKNETWKAVDSALRDGLRGMTRGSSLARLLADKRGVRNRLGAPQLTRPQILRWAEAHYAGTGKWPSSNSGTIAGAAGETWKGVDLALRHGYRGLPRGPSLAKLLAAERKVRNRTNLPPLTPQRILDWADAYYRRVGDYPTSTSGPIAEAGGETWGSVNLALRYGYRGLPGGASLSRLLRQKGRRLLVRGLRFAVRQGCVPRAAASTAASPQGVPTGSGRRRRPGRRNAAVLASAHSVATRCHAHPPRGCLRRWRQPAPACGRSASRARAGGERPRQPPRFRPTGAARSTRAAGRPVPLPPEARSWAGKRPKYCTSSRNSARV